MKAITVKQPWASLIVHGIKDIENRTWKTNFRGRVLIHAAANIDDRALTEMFPSYAAHCAFADSELNGAKLPTSAIIGSVEIVDCLCHTHHSIKDTKSIWAEEDVWHWVLANPILFPKPIPAKGKLSFWESGVEVCHICGQPSDIICAQCGEYFCQKHTVSYNQFTQIDYDCCTACAPTGPESE